MSDRVLFIVDGTGAVCDDRRIGTWRKCPDLAPLLFAHRLAEIQRRWNPWRLVVAFDGPNQFRTELIPKYKPLSTRTARPEDFVVVDTCFYWIMAQGIPHYRVDRYEARDIAATLALRHDGPVVFCSSGELACFLLEPSGRVAILRTFSSDKEGFRRAKWFRWSDLSEQVWWAGGKFWDFSLLDYYCLKGIPGARGAMGVGSLRAQLLLDEYGDLEALASAMPDIRIGRRRFTVREIDALNAMFRVLPQLRACFPCVDDLDLADLGSFGAEMPDLRRFLEIQ